MLCFAFFYFRLKGEENTVMVDYVLPDFSTIKKGFCKVMVEISSIFGLFSSAQVHSCWLKIFFLMLHCNFFLFYSLTG